MKKIQVSTLSAGIAFDKPVYIDADNILVEAYEAIKATDLERLNKWKIAEVETDGEVTKPKQKNKILEPEGPEKVDILEVKEHLIKAASAYDEIETLLGKGIKLMKQAYETMVSEKPFQVSLVRNLAEEITSHMHLYPNSFIHLYYSKTENSIYKHIVYSAFFGAQLAYSISYSQPKIIELVFSILLMDVGMTFLPHELLIKEGKLTDDEKKLLQAHTLKGYQLLTQKVKVKNNIAEVALQHQEHFDGSGYPRNMKGEDISEFARIAMIADSYTALLEDKNYRAKKHPYEAMKELLALGIYYYDPRFMRSFLNRFSIYPVGSMVELSDSSIALVAGVVPEKPMRPILYILRGTDGEVPDPPMFVHLLYKSNLYITGAVFPEEKGIDYYDEMRNITGLT